MFPLCLNVTALFLRILSDRRSKKARARGMITRCHVTSNMIIVINERDMYTRVRPDQMHVDASMDVQCLRRKLSVAFSVQCEKRIEYIAVFISFCQVNVSFQQRISSVIRVKRHRTQRNTINLNSNFDSDARSKQYRPIRLADIVFLSFPFSIPKRSVASTKP